MLKEISEHLLSEDYTHCLVCWSGDVKEGKLTIHHIGGYTGLPKKETIESLINELRISEEFHMTDLIFGRDYLISLLETSELATFQETIENSGATTEGDDPYITTHEG